MRKPHLALLSVGILYGLNYAVAKDLMPDYIQPFGFIFFRILIATIFFWISGSFYSQKIRKKDFFTLALCAFFGVFANQLMFFYGLNITSPVNASIIMTVNPVLILLASILILKAKITWHKVIGVILGIFGALIIILFNKQQVSSKVSTIWGDAFVFFNACSYSLYLVLAAPLMRRYHPITVIKWIFLIGFIYSIPFTINQALATDWSLFTYNTWGSFFFVIIGATCLTYAFNLYGMKKLGPAVVGSYIYLQPLVATIFSFFRGESELNFLKILGAILIFLGVYFVSRKKRVSLKTLAEKKSD